MIRRLGIGGALSCRLDDGLVDGRGDTIRTCVSLLPKQVADHWPTPRLVPSRGLEPPQSLRLAWVTARTRCHLGVRRQELVRSEGFEPSPESIVGQAPRACASAVFPPRARGFGSSAGIRTRDLRSESATAWPLAYGAVRIWWTRRELHPPHDACKALSPLTEHAGPDGSAYGLRSRDFLRDRQARTLDSSNAL